VVKQMSLLMDEGRRVPQDQGKGKEPSRKGKSTFFRSEERALRVRAYTQKRDVSYHFNFEGEGGGVQPGRCMDGRGSFLPKEKLHFEILSKSLGRVRGKNRVPDALPRGAQGQTWESNW